MALVAAALLRSLSARTRGITTSAVVVSTLARVAVVVAAERIAEGEAGGSAAFAVAAGALFGVERILASSLRVNAECDAILALSRALLHGDVMSEPEPSARNTMAEGASSLPQLASAMVTTISGAVATVVVLPFVVPRLPSSVLVGALAAAIVLLAAMTLLRGRIGRLQAEVVTEQQRVYDAASWVLEGRLEVAARGGEGKSLEALQRTLEHYRGVAQRNASWSALLGRAPLAAALLTVAVVTLATSRALGASELATHALLLTAVAASPIAAALAVNELIRAVARLAPFAALTAMPPRPEMKRDGVSASLPSRIEADAISFAYQADADDVVRQVSFAWNPGEPLLLAGRNGAGKSTLLKLILGLRAPRAGEISIDAKALDSIDLVSLRRKAAYLPQRPYLGEAHTTVRESLVQVLGRFDDADAEAALARLELLADLQRRGSALDVAVGTLSAGQRQRLALARILLTRASVFLLDEPDANLDRAGVVLLEELARELVAGGAMVAIVAHDHELLSIAGRRIDL